MLLCIGCNVALLASVGDGPSTKSGGEPSDLPFLACLICTPTLERGCDACANAVSKCFNIAGLGAEKCCEGGWGVWRRGAPRGGSCCMAWRGVACVRGVASGARQPAQRSAIFQRGACCHFTNCCRGYNVWEGLSRDVRTPEANTKWLQERPLPVSNILSTFRSMLMAAWDHERLASTSADFSTDTNTQPGVMMCRYRHWMRLPLRGAACSFARRKAAATPTAIQ